MLRGEGFRFDEIATVRNLVALSDREELDAGHDVARDARMTAGTAQTGEAVTALSG